MGPTDSNDPQHRNVSNDAFTVLLPIADISTLNGCPDFDEDCQSMCLDAVIACRDHDYPRLTGVCDELQRRQV